MKEIEVLVELLEDKKQAIKKLSQISKCKINKTHDTYYFHENNDKLKPTNNSFPRECFRIRIKQKKHYLTYKIDNYNKKGEWIYSDEYETEVKDLEQTKKIIELLGYKKLVDLENTKYTFNTKKFEIVLEEVKELGLFLEIELKLEENKTPEKSKEEIREFIKQLKLKTGKELNKGKPELMLEKNNKLV